MTIKRIHVADHSDHEYPEWGVVTMHEGELWLMGLGLAGVRLPDDPDEAEKMWLDIIHDTVERVQPPHEPVAVVLMTHAAWANPVRAGQEMLADVMRRVSEDVGLPFASGAAEAARARHDDPNLDDDDWE